MKKIVTLFIVLLAFATLLGVGAFTYPIYRTPFVLANHPKNVHVVQDGGGIFHIKSDDTLAALKALGQAAASERLFQMEMLKRTTFGKLSEAVGARAKERDIYFRTLNYDKIASDAVNNWLTLPENNALKAQLESYLAGLNDVVASVRAKPWLWPNEYKILRLKPSFFEMKDLFGVFLYMHSHFSGAQYADRSISSTLSSVEKKFWPLFFDEPLVSSPGMIQSKSETKFEDLPLETLPQEEGFVPPMKFFNLGQINHEPLMGSNAWLCNGMRTTSGKPTLANDPHVGFSLPGIFFEAEIATPDFQVRGFFLPMIPYPVIGFTPHSAWGITIAPVDQTDFYKIELNEKTFDTSDKYKWDNSFKNLTSRSEEIFVRGQKSEVVTIKETHIGPILRNPFAIETSYVAISDVVARAPATSILALAKLLRASRPSGVHEALDLHVAPAINVFWSNDSGDTVFSVAGKAPDRPWTVQQLLASYGAQNSSAERYLKSLAAKGGALLPSQTTFQWGKLNSSSDEVFVTEFPEGCLSNGNDAFYDIFPEESFLGSTGYDLGLRARRMKDLLSRNDVHDINTFKDIQLDHQDNLAFYVLPKLLEKVRGAQSSLDLEIIFNELNSWNLETAPEQKAPLYFHEWMTAWRDEVFKEFPGEVKTYWDERGSTNAQLILVWTKIFNDPGTLSSMLEKKLKDAWEQVPLYLRKHSGSNFMNTTWGDLHTLSPRHGLNDVPFFGKFFRAPAKAIAGSSVSVSKQSYRGYLSGHDFKSVHGSAMRGIFPLGNTDLVQIIKPTGNSGVAKSKFYLDSFEEYVQGQYRSAPFMF